MSRPSGDAIRDATQLGTQRADTLGSSSYPGDGTDSPPVADGVIGFWSP